jgi:hypothetical protein
MTGDKPAIRVCGRATRPLGSCCATHQSMADKSRSSGSRAGADGRRSTNAPMRAKGDCQRAEGLPLRYKVTKLH